MKRLYYIYKLTLPNGKIYIGQTIDLARRFLSYRSLDCKSQIKLYESLKFYEWDCIKIELLYCNITDQKDIDIREEAFIMSIPKELRLNIRTSVKTFNPKKGKDSNLSKPIYQLNKSLEIIKEWDCLSQISEFLGKKCNNISNAIVNQTYFAYGFYWCHKSNYDKNTFKVPKKKHYKTKKIVQLTKRAVYIRTFNSIQEAAEYIKGLQSNISAVCSGIKASAYGFIWAYEKDYLTENFKIRGNLKVAKKVKMFDLQNNYIKTFNSTNDAVLETGLSRITIMRSCNKKTKMPYKFKFEYE